MLVKQDTEEKKNKVDFARQTAKANSSPRHSRKALLHCQVQKHACSLLSSSLGCIPFSAFGKRSETAGKIISGVVSIV